MGKITLEYAKSYRNKLVEYGKKVNFENPDNLSQEELMALTAKIFDDLNRLDMAMGYPPHDTGLRAPASISKERQVELFFDFVDWYQVVPTHSQAIFQYVIQKYPMKEYPRILCVGDGEKCHLGRKLAMRGYQVVSMDPEAEPEMAVIHKNKCRQAGKGEFLVAKENFSKDSTHMINWANIIVGSKVPPIVEDLVAIDKPTIFSISSNPEAYHIQFNGIPITSEAQFKRLIQGCEGVKMITTNIEDEGQDPFVIFEKEGRTFFDIEEPDSK